MESQAQLLLRVGMAPPISGGVFVVERREPPVAAARTQEPGNPPFRFAQPKSSLAPQQRNVKSRDPVTSGAGTPRGGGGWVAGRAADRWLVSGEGLDVGACSPYLPAKSETPETVSTWAG